MGRVFGILHSAVVCVVLRGWLAQTSLAALGGDRPPLVRRASSVETAVERVRSSAVVSAVVTGRTSVGVSAKEAVGASATARFRYICSTIVLR